MKNLMLVMMMATRMSPTTFMIFLGIKRMSQKKMSFKIIIIRMKKMVLK